MVNNTGSVLHKLPQTVIIAGVRRHWLRIIVSVNFNFYKHSSYSILHCTALLQRKTQNVELKYFLFSRRSKEDEVWTVQVELDSFLWREIISSDLMVSRVFRSSDSSVRGSLSQPGIWSYFYNFKYFVNLNIFTFLYFNDDWKSVQIVFNFSAASSSTSSSSSSSSLSSLSPLSLWPGVSSLFGFFLRYFCLFSVFLLWQFPDNFLSLTEPTRDKRNWSSDKI